MISFLNSVCVLVSFFILFPSFAGFLYIFSIIPWKNTNDSDNEIEFVILVLIVFCFLLSSSESASFSSSDSVSFSDSVEITNQTDVIQMTLNFKKNLTKLVFFL